MSQIPARIINAESKIVVERTLPVPGEVLTQRGLQVEPTQVIARASIPQQYRVIDVARALARPKVDMAEVMLKAVGDEVEAGEAVAMAKGRLFQRKAYAPAAGKIGVIGPGWVLLEVDPLEIELQAFVRGTVTQLIPERGVMIETTGTMIEVACGFGGEATGQLKCVADSPTAWPNMEAIDEEAGGMILLAGGTVDEDILRLAEAAQVSGIIVGSIPASLLTLEPAVSLCLVTTEGFGHAPMAAYTFEMLQALDGQEVSIRGCLPYESPQPPVILAGTGVKVPPTPANVPPISVGSRVRITRGTLLGAQGVIDSVATEPQSNGAGLTMPGVYVRLDGAIHYVPWMNLEEIRGITR